VELFRPEANVNMLVAQALGYGKCTSQTKIILLT